MAEIDMPALVGTNPLGFLAALGVLYCADAQGGAADGPPRLSWTNDVEPHAVLSGVQSARDLLDRLEAERDAVAACTALNWPVENPLTTAKPNPTTLRAWALACHKDADPRSASVFNALVAEGAYAGKGVAKPSHLDFTAGQQQLLAMARQLAVAADRRRLEEALSRWNPSTEHPSLSFDPADERLYALRAINPSGDKKPSTPGANWLAFLGLLMLPVVNTAGSLQTTACAGTWKRSSMEWFLWQEPLTRHTVAALLRGGAAYLPSKRPVKADIRRTDQGGYGSFSGVIRGPRESGAGAPNPLLRMP